MSVKYKPRNKTSYTKPTHGLTREIKTERTKTKRGGVYTHCLTSTNGHSSFQISPTVIVSPSNSFQKNACNNSPPPP